MEGIVPATVAVAETFEDLLDEPLFPQEETALSRMVEKRTREFRTVRACARAALGQLGIPRPPMVPGRRGAPTWPQGIVGSMTHCTGYKAVGVARVDQLLSLGLDAEPHAPLPDGVLRLIAAPGEQSHLAKLEREHPAVHWDRLLFSAKESIYKAWYPLSGRWLGFEDVRLTIDRWPRPSVEAFSMRG